jgi:hypothetical protein
MATAYQRKRAAETAAKNFTKDGRSKHALYDIWRGMFRRTDTRPTYIERGTFVDERWEDPRWFYGWIEENLGPRPSSGHSLDRIDNDGNYEPGNVRWADAKTQANNRGSRKRAAGWADDGPCLCTLAWRYECPCDWGSVCRAEQIPRNGFDPVHRPPVCIEHPSAVVQLVDGRQPGISTESTALPQDEAYVRELELWQMHLTEFSFD